MTPEWDGIRQELIRLAKRRECRRTDFSAAIPCEWSPQSVWDPRFGMFFTEPGAWAYIIELLESGCEFTPKTMEKPPDTIAYEFALKLAPNLPELYIKVQSFKGKILGRSFHNSTKEVRT